MDHLVSSLRRECEDLSYFMGQHPRCNQKENRYMARIVVVNIKVQSSSQCSWGFRATLSQAEILRTRFHCGSASCCFSRVANRGACEQCLSRAAIPCHCHPIWS